MTHPSSIIGYNSAYLNHLERVKRDEKERFLGVPPFFVLIAVALTLHVGLLLPSYFLHGSQHALHGKQIHLAFGKKSTHQGGAGNAKQNGMQHESSMEDAVSSLDSMFQPTPRPVISPSPVTSSSIVESDTALIATSTPDSDTLKIRPARAITGNVSASSRHNRGGERVKQRPSGINNGAGSVGEESGGSGGNEGNGGDGGTDAAVREVISKYEQLLSGWIERHKIYPADALRQRLQGRVVLRLRITRNGAVVMKSIERSSGHVALDTAVLDTVTRSIPMPVVPSEYPGGAQVEFLIPINFSMR